MKTRVYRLLTVAFCAVAALTVTPPCIAQNAAPYPTPAPYVIRVPFYAAANRADLIRYNEYRYVATGLAGTASYQAIKQSDYDKEVAKRQPEAEKFLASGRVEVVAAQRVRLILTLPTNFGSFEVNDRKGLSNYIARGTALFPLRLVELLEGPRKGQQVWTSASLWLEENQGK